MVFRACFLVALAHYNHTFCKIFIKRYKNRSRKRFVLFEILVVIYVSKKSG